MDHGPDVFISYANADSRDVAESLKSNMNVPEIGLDAWVYSHDRTPGEGTWDEIEQRIRSVAGIVFIVSDATASSEGQKKELELAVRERDARSIPIVPLILRAKRPGTCGRLLMPEIPAELEDLNREEWDPAGAQRLALKIAQALFPELLARDGVTWCSPRPGQWLRVSSLDRAVEGDFCLGDEVYFRRISFLGLFECYSPKHRGLYWLFPSNVQPASEKKDYQALEWREVPRRYRVMTMAVAEERGMRRMFPGGKRDVDSEEH